MNTIKCIRERTKMSQRQFASHLGIPVRTLQKWEQQESDPLPYLEEFIKEKCSLEEYISVEKYLIKPTNVFKPVIKHKFKNINRIHPIQQQRVDDILEVLKQYDCVEKVVVFGSSVTNECNYDSDIDLYVELSEDKNVKIYNVDCPVDYWTNYTVVPEMLDEINKKGVVVYDR